MKLFVAVLTAVLAAQSLSGQSPDTTHSIRFSTILGGAVVFNQIAAEMTRQNIAVTSEFPHVIMGTPLDAPDIQIRVNIAESSDLNVVMLSAVGISGGGRFTYQGTGGSSAPSMYTVDRGTHRGREWKRIEDLAAALRKTLAGVK